MKFKELSINYPFAYQDSTMDHMRLNLSDDKKFFCLSCRDAKDKNSEIHFMAYRCENL